MAIFSVGEKYAFVFLVFRLDFNDYLCIFSDFWACTDAGPSFLVQVGEAVCLLKEEVKNATTIYGRERNMKVYEGKNEKEGPALRIFLCVYIEGSSGSSFASCYKSDPVFLSSRIVEPFRFPLLLLLLLLSTQEFQKRAPILPCSSDSR